MSPEENVLKLTREAIRALVVGPDDVKRRLRTAFIYHLGYILEKDVPEDLALLLSSIRKRLTREPRYKGQSTVESALFRMHKSTASKIAKDIFELYLALAGRRHSKITLLTRRSTRTRATTAHVG